MPAAPTYWMNISFVFPSLDWNWPEKGMFVSAQLQSSIAWQLPLDAYQSSFVF
jgi:hypothetical protein